VKLGQVPASITKVINGLLSIGFEPFNADSSDDGRHTAIHFQDSQTTISISVPTKK
jgi:hypothetical protein